MFRDFVRRKARKLGLTGFVRNETNGTVSAVAEGDEPNLEIFLEDLKRGPVFSKIAAVESAWSEATGEFNAFEIKFYSDQP